MSDDAEIPKHFGFTRRQRAVLRFALLRMAEDAHRFENAALQDVKNRRYSKDAPALFLRDAKDAEALYELLKEE